MIVIKVVCMGGNVLKLIQLGFINLMAFSCAGENFESCQINGINCFKFFVNLFNVPVIRMMFFSTFFCSFSLVLFYWFRL